MALRPFVTAGVSFAAAGAVAVTLALAPPLTPRDIQVAKSTEVSLAAVVTDPYFQSLINTYFASGAAGVAQQLLVQLAGADASGVALVNGYFNGGVSEVIRQYLVNANPTNIEGNTYINTFFGIDADGPGPSYTGAFGVLYDRLKAGDLTAEQEDVLDDLYEGGFTLITKNRLLAGTTDPEQIQFINDFFDGGASLVVRNRLLAATSDPEQQQFISDFFDGGASLVAYRRSGGDVGTPDLTTPDPDDLAPTSTPYLSAFYGINNNILDPDGTGNPGLSGVSGVVYQRLTEGLAPGTEERALVDELFNNGFSGVVRYILTGPLPAPPPPPAPTIASVPEEDTTLQRVAAVETTEQTPEKSEVTEAKTVAADVGDAPKAPVAAPVAVAAPKPVVAAPAPEAVTAPPVSEVKTKTKTDSEPETDVIKDGNKLEPVIILGAGGAKNKEPSWGVFGQIAEAIGKGLAGAGAPAAPAGGAPGETGGSPAGGAEG